MNFPRPIPELAQTFQEQDVVTLPGLVDPITTGGLLRSIDGGPFREVNLGTDHPDQIDVHWSEQEIPPSHPAYAFCGQSALTELVTLATGSPTNPDKQLCWANCYQVEKYIGPHKDGGGAAALYICLKTVAGPELGGSLVVGNDQKSPTKVFLRPGDGVLLRATEVVHYTEPLQASAADPEPERVILATRYYTAE